MASVPGIERVSDREEGGRSGSQNGGLHLYSAPSSFASSGATSVAPLASYQKANMDNGKR